MSAATVIAVASGKGGVGKTNVAVNLAVALTRLRRRVAIVDADFGLGNVDVLLGLRPDAHIGHVLTGERELSDVMIAGPGGIQILPASSGLRDLTWLSPAQRARLVRAFTTLREAVDFVLIDTATGISENVIQTLRLAQRIMLVTSTDPAAIVDAYATAKVISMTVTGREVGVVVNSVTSGEDAMMTFRQLDMAATKFLDQTLSYYGFVPHDSTVQRAVATQRAVVEMAPQAPASRALRVLASRLAGMGPVTDSGLRIVKDAAQHAAAPEVPRCA